MQQAVGLVMGATDIQGRQEARTHAKWGTKRKTRLGHDGRC
jgi:hypothetical protein